MAARIGIPPRVALLGALAALMLLSACAGLRETRLNPFNWFGRSTETPTLEPEGGWQVVTDNRILVQQVTELEVMPVSGGAMIRAVGLPPTQGWWDAELLAEGDEMRPEGGVLRLAFVIAEPRRAQREGTPMSREVSVALYLSDIRLEDVRQITVSGERNARTVARRR